jgi:hypothetical protein
MEMASEPNRTLLEDGAGGFGDISQGEVLWIDPETYRLAERPDGFALHVLDFLGWGGDDPGRRQRVWVRGPVLDRRGVPGMTLTLCVPVDQRRAVPARRVYGTAVVGRHRDDDAAGERDMIGPPPGYRRRAVT